MTSAAATFEGMMHSRADPFNAGKALTGAVAQEQSFVLGQGRGREP